MVNTLSGRRSDLRALTGLVRAYLAVVVATLAACAALSVLAPDQAPAEAWGHAAIVAKFAVLLPLRLRSARQGSVGGLRAVGLIAAVLFVVNVVEALVPGFVPVWMKVQMVVVAVIMAGVIALVVRERV